MALRPVADDQWDVVAWLWQDFRHDLAPAVGGLPYADGRYRHEWLDAYPAPDRHGHLAWEPHPNTGEDAPVGFALVSPGLEREHLMQAFFVVPAARRGGYGTRMAREVVGLHPGGWEIPFQHDNVAAAPFWRRVAEAAWGEGWVETREAVPHKPEAPEDHWIRTT